MTPGKIITYGSCFLFSLIALTAILRGGNSGVKEEKASVIREIVLDRAIAPKEKVKPALVTIAKKAPEEEHLPDADRIALLFATDSSRLPIVETVSYTSRVPWLKGRAAWISDYASHYSTSRHFIARSLNRTTDYFTQKVSSGDRFNVFRADKNIEFYLVIDLSRCKMWFYYWDKEKDDRLLLKTYNIGVGRRDARRLSGYVTPVGKYSAGSKVAIYKPGTMGYFQDRKTEMITVFGTRWIPFDEEIEGCSESAKGFGIHGTPWVKNSKGDYIEEVDKIKQYDSDGCIRLSTVDIEELFSIIITKPTTVELVHDFHDAHLPGKEPEGGDL